MVVPGPEFDRPLGTLLLFGTLTLSREAGPDGPDGPVFERPESFALPEGEPNLVHPPVLRSAALRSDEPLALLPALFAPPCGAPDDIGPALRSAFPLAPTLPIPRGDSDPRLPPGICTPPT